MSKFQLNQKLISHQNKIRECLNEWALNKSYALAARVRIEFEEAVLSAIEDSDDWAFDTSPELCEALGHCTLEGYLR